jgi:hypothetical protein
MARQVQVETGFECVVPLASWLQSFKPAAAGVCCVFNSCTAQARPHAAASKPVLELDLLPVRKSAQLAIHTRNSFLASFV